MKPERNILKPQPGTKAIRGNDLASERQRLAQIVAAAAVPSECGGRIVPAPARGAFRTEPQTQLVPQGEEDWAQAEAGFAGWQPIRAVDWFDVVERADRKADRPATFTPGQVAIARRYRDLTEKHSSAGVKCSDLIGRTGGGSGRDFMDMLLAEGRELEAMRRRIGLSVAMSVRRVRPSARGGAGRRSIPDLVLVDMVCLGGRSISDVLRAHGWAVFGDNRKALTEALSGALNRMIGYRDEKTS